jgi:hypothetical protein
VAYFLHVAILIAVYNYSIYGYFEHINCLHGFLHTCKYVTLHDIVVFIVSIKSAA